MQKMLILGSKLLNGSTIDWYQPQKRLTEALQTQLPENRIVILPLPVKGTLSICDPGHVYVCVCMGCV